MPEEILKDKPKRRPAWEIYIGVILGALLFGAIGYLAGSKNTNTTSDATATVTTAADDTATVSDSTTTAATDVTANWKTYTNDTYGYSLKYPSDFSIKAVSNQMLNINESSAANSPLVLAVSEDSAATGADISQTLDEIAQTTGQGSDSGKNTDSGKTTLDSVPAYEFAGQGIDNNSYSLIAKNNGHLYLLAFENLPATTESYMVSDAKSQLSATEKTILSTFQFTK